MPPGCPTPGTGPRSPGLHGLRSWFARAASPDADAGDVLVTAGGQGAITAAFRALVPAGGPLLVESPTYPGALAVARAAGLRPVPVPADAFGVIPDLLADAFARTGALAFYCQPAYHNPAGTVLAGPRREAVLAAAAAAGAFVIEDDCGRWLAHGQRPPPTLLAADRDGRVVYLTSLTKAASPSLRVGALIARGPVAARLRALRVVDDMFVARPVQEAALELVSGPAWDRHLRGLGQALTGRARALVRRAGPARSRRHLHPAGRRHAPVGPAAGRTGRRRGGPGRPPVGRGRHARPAVLPGRAAGALPAPDLLGRPGQRRPRRRGAPPGRRRPRAGPSRGRLTASGLVGARAPATICRAWASACDFAVLLRPSPPPAA